MEEKREKVLVRKRSKKISLDPNLENLRLAAETGKVVYGYKEVIDALKNSKPIAVFIAKNAREDVLKSLEERCKEKNLIPIYINTSLEIGQTIGKPFLVSAVAVLEKGEAKL
ncbi:MAG: ribosomal L7Ae/L30e/S12e/Gadd45 family protein [Candidatus Anstonellales archaeon]